MREREDQRRFRSKEKRGEKGTPPHPRPNPKQEKKKLEGNEGEEFKIVKFCRYNGVIYSRRVGRK